MQSHQLMMLKPMCLGVSGYARLQCTGNHAMLQINIRGVSCERVQAFWYAGEGQYVHVGDMNVNQKKEAALTTQLPSLFYGPQRLQALLLLDDEPRPSPLLVGLCTGQSAGSLLDAKNAALALCEKQIKAKPQPTKKETVSKVLPPLKPLKKPVSSSAPPSPPKEIFLPAIDPLPYIVASDPQAPVGQSEAPKTVKRIPRDKDALPCDALPKRIWPKGYEGLAPYFIKERPCAPFDLPSWRFVALADQGVLVGYAHVDGKIHHIGYAYEGETAPNDQRPYHLHIGQNGKPYQVLWQQLRV